MAGLIAGISIWHFFSPTEISQNDVNTVSMVSQKKIKAKIYLPTEQNLKNEIQLSADSTPIALLALADELATKMESAKSDEIKARNLFTDLTACVNNTELKNPALSVRAFCFDTAKMLVSFHPGLFERAFENLKAHLEDPIKPLVAPLIVN